MVKWLVVSCTGDAKDEQNPCSNKSSASFDSSFDHFVLAKSGNKRVLATWSRSDPIIDDSVKKAVKHFKDATAMEGMGNGYENKIDFAKARTQNLYGYYDHMNKKVLFSYVRR